MSNQESNTDVETRKEYLEYRQLYADIKHQQCDQYDKYMLSLSSGSFALTFAFINDIVKGSFNQKEVLLLGWTMFVLAILSTLLSFKFSQLAHDRAIIEIDKCYEDENHVFKESFSNIVVKALNWYSLGFFVFGICFILAFVTINI
jgi:hypothetical protein